MTLYWNDDFSNPIPPTKFKYKLLSAPTKQELIDHNYIPTTPEPLTYLVRRAFGGDKWYPVRTPAEEGFPNGKYTKFSSALEAKLHVDRLMKEYADDYNEWIEAACAYAEDVRDAAIAEAECEYKMTVYKIKNEHGKVIG